MRTIISALCLFCILFNTSLRAQDVNSKAIEKSFTTYLESNYQEKIYLHTDKNTYLAGELLWFKIFNTEAYTNRPLSIGKIAYVEILNDQNQSLLQTKVELKDGSGSGSIYLPTVLPSGNYTLRSYTNWMKNFDPAFYFHKKLIIYNTLKEESESPKAITKPAQIQFFPEGGNLVYGLNSRVAFKAVDESGAGLNFRGAILNGANDTVARFTPSEFGIGSFYLNPKEGEVYRAVIYPVKAKSFNANLPEIYKNGAVMTVKPGVDSALNVNIQQKLDKVNGLTLFVHSGHKVVFTKSISASDAGAEVSVPLDALGEGISHLTLFNGLVPLCERLYLKKRARQINIDLITNKKIYAPREKVNIDITQALGSRPVKSNFSVSVFKADSLQMMDDDIATYLYLTSELKGRVENAEWYLNNASQEALDNLMLTHGWRRFKWEDVLAPQQKDFKYLPEIQGPIISGKLFNSTSKAPLADKQAYLSIPGRRTVFYTATSNNRGEINFFTKKHYGPAEIIAQPDLLTDSLIKIEIEQPFSSKVAPVEESRFNYKVDTRILTERSIAMQVNNAYYTKYLNKEQLPSIDSAAFFTLPDKVYKLDDYVRFTTMEEVLREYVPEVSVAIRKKSYHLKVFDPVLKSFYSAAPLILIDGVPVFDSGDAIIKFDPLKVQSLEVVARSYLYGQNNFAGIVSFKTYKGDLAGFELPKQAEVLDFEGLQYQREFYSPMYDGDSSASTHLPDYRTTLFWSADNQTDSAGKSNLNFFTSDLPGKYRVVIQALSKEGEAGYKVIDFEVADRLTSLNPVK